MDTKKTEGNLPGFVDGASDCEANAYVLRLYIADELPASVTARCNIEALCEEYLTGACDLQVIDIYKEPRTARKEQILATPTLVKMRPLPVKKFVGTMSNREVLLAGLGLQPH